MSLRLSYIKHKDKAKKYNRYPRKDAFPRWVKYLVVYVGHACGVVFLIGCIIAFLGGSSEDVLILFALFGFIGMCIVFGVSLGFPLYCGLHLKYMKHLGRKIAKELATEWLSKQTGLRLSLYDSVLSEGTVDVLNVRYYGFRNESWTIWVTYYSTQKNPSDDIIYAISFDENFIIARVTQYQKTSDTFLKRHY